jgi:aarF domain-containing kinase
MRRDPRFEKASISRAERLRRARRISLGFSRIYLGIKTHQMIARRLRPADMAERWSSFHRVSAESIFRTAIELKGLILKGCQFMGARADVLPPEYVDALSRLQGRVPPRHFSVVKRSVERELGAPLDAIFSDFDEWPIASASLAQVHGATLTDGRRVAVKVQYPEIAQLIRGDLANLRLLFRAVGYLERDFDLMPLIEELGDTIPLELDFVNEGRNAETAARFFKSREDVVIPEIIWEYTTQRVLVMEFLEGIKITEVEALRAEGVDLERLLKLLVEIFCEQILVHGFFHADPHPGNLLVQPDGPKLVLLDFGLAKALPPHFRTGVAGLATSLLLGDVDRMPKALVDLGFETRDQRPESLREIATLMLRLSQVIRSRTGTDSDTISDLRREIPRRVRENPIVRIPHHLVLLGRVVSLLSGVKSSLGARVDILGTIAPYALGCHPDNEATPE